MTMQHRCPNTDLVGPTTPNGPALTPNTLVVTIVIVLATLWAYVEGGPVAVVAAVGLAADLVTLFRPTR